MRLQRSPSPRKTATNLSIDASLLADARALNLNLSRAAEAGIAAAVREAHAAAWLEENCAALEGSNAFVETYGLPLEKFRLF